MKKLDKYRPSSFSILIIFILLMIVGVSLLQSLNVQLTPSRSLPGLSVGYSGLDASARVIEQEVASKLERLFSGVKGIKEVSSVSAKGYGYINLSFKKMVNLTNMDMNLFQNQLSKKKNDLRTVTDRLQNRNTEPENTIPL